MTMMQNAQQQMPQQTQQGPYQGTVVFATLPKTSTGKIQKFVLRDQARAMAQAEAEGVSV